MKLGSDFWFWVRLIIEILKAIMGFEPKSNPGTVSMGHAAFNAILAALVEENEDDMHKAKDLNPPKGK